MTRALLFALCVLTACTNPPQSEAPDAGGEGSDGIATSPGFADPSPDARTSAGAACACPAGTWRLIREDGSVACSHDDRDAVVTPCLESCSFVCAGEELTADGKQTLCAGGATCAPEPSCSDVWRADDRLECDVIRTQDGRAYVGRANNCVDIHRDGTWQGCVAGPPRPSCALSCLGDATLSCDASGCTCTIPSGGSFACVGAP